MLVDWLIFALSLCAVATFTCCCSGTCPRCQGVSPEEIEVVISGLANDGCTSCASVDGTYTLTRLSASNSDFILNGVNCFWVYYFPGGSACDAYAIALELPSVTFGTTTVSLYFVDTGTRIDFFSNLPTTATGPGGSAQVDCEFAAEVLPFFGYFDPGTCDGAAATATLTAL